MSTVDVKRIEALAGPVLAGLGYELVDLEWKHESGAWVLRLFIDRVPPSDDPADGISLDDCSRASHAMSAELDVADFIHVHYSLEVSSPGLDRPLRREADFRRFAGRKAKVRARRGLTGVSGEQRRNFAGTLLGAEGGKLRIDVGGGQVFELDVDDVEKANLQYEFQGPAQR